MGLFGGSSSKSSTSQSQVGSQTQLGDPIAIHIAAGKKSQQHINLVRSTTVTDFGSVEKSFDLANKALDGHKDILKAADDQAKRGNVFALDTIAAAERVSSEIIAAGQYSAGATERIAGAFEAFVDEQNNPNEKNQMVLIVGAVGVLAFLISVKK